MSNAPNAPRDGAGSRSGARASVRDDEPHSRHDQTHDGHRGRDHHDDGPDSAGITAIVLGILGIVAGLIAMAGFMPLILGIIALVLGVAALAAAGAAWSSRKPDAPKAKGSLIGGLALGGVAAILGAVVVAMVATNLQSMDETVDRLELEIEQLTDEADDVTD